MAFELISTVILLATKPFSLFRFSCLFGIRSLCIVIETWIELLKAAIYVHLTIIWSAIICAVTILSLPMRLLNALRKERQLEMYLRELQSALENLAWDRKKLREQLQATIKEQRMMEMMLAELEDEHDEAIVKIELLEGELQDLKEENQRLKEFQGKSAWDESQIYKCPSNCGISPLKHSPDQIDLPCHEINRKEVREEQGRHQAERHDVVKAEQEAMVSRNSNVVDIVLIQSREVAVYRSLFSTILSLLVGMIIWGAKEPCIPLVVALFTVVGMSLKSVVEFFSTIRNKPASDAVALLSFNWFILGTLTYPMLPRVACTLAPLAARLLARSLRLLGIPL